MANFCGIFDQPGRKCVKSRIWVQWHVGFHKRLISELDSANAKSNVQTTRLKNCSTDSLIQLFLDGFLDGFAKQAPSLDITEWTSGLDFHWFHKICTCDLKILVPNSFTCSPVKKRNKLILSNEFPFPLCYTPVLDYLYHSATKLWKTLSNCKMIVT